MSNKTIQQLPSHVRQWFTHPSPLGPDRTMENLIAAEHTLIRSIGDRDEFQRHFLPSYTTLQTYVRETLATLKDRTWLFHDGYRTNENLQFYRDVDVSDIATFDDFCHRHDDFLRPVPGSRRFARQSILKRHENTLRGLSSTLQRFPDLKGEVQTLLYPRDAESRHRFKYHVTVMNDRSKKYFTHEGGLRWYLLPDYHLTHGLLWKYIVLHQGNTFHGKRITSSLGHCIGTQPLTPGSMLEEVSSRILAHLYKHQLLTFTIPYQRLVYRSR